MSFATEILKPISSKVILFEIDVGKQNDFWVSYAAGVWIVNFLNTYAKITSFTDYPTVAEINLVGSVTADGLQLSRVSTPQACIEVDSSFHFESGTKTLYIHCPGGDDPDLFKMRIGQVWGFRLGGECASYGGVDYQNRLISAPNISLNKDPQFYGSISFGTLSAKIVNTDGAYDLLTRDNYIFGNKGRVRVGFDCWPLTDFVQIFEGTITTINTNDQDITFELIDQRASLTRPTPYNVFTTEEYPNLNENDIYKPIPRVFGTCKNCPVYVYDQDQSTSQFIPSTDIYHVKISDTEYTSQIDAVNAIYVNGELTTSSDVDLSVREFTLKHTTSTATNKYNPGDAVTADLVGEVDEEGDIIENGATIIRKLLLDYYDIPYTGDFYNFAKWEEGSARDIGIWLGEDQEKLIDIIGKICADGIQGDFFYDGLGRFCLDIFNENTAVTQSLARNQILETPTIKDDPSKVVTSVLVGYEKDWAYDEYRLYVNFDNEEDIFDKYPVYNQQKFMTLVTDITEAQNYSSVVFDKSSDVETIIEVKVPGWICIQREIGEFVVFYCDRPTKSIYNRVKAEIIGFEKDLNNHIVTLTTRLISRIDDVPYTQSYFYVDNYASSLDKIYYIDNDAGTDKRYYGVTINQE